MNNKYHVSVLVSGSGTNMQAVIDACLDGRLARLAVVKVISSRADAYALERAQIHGIPAVTLAKKDYACQEDFSQKMIKELQAVDTDIVLLAGYMRVLDPQVIKRYRGRIVNIHPSLIPKYCGKGFYGMHVHQAVIAGGESESGATVHYVDEGIDTGPIILQQKVPVFPEDTPEVLAARVLAKEHETLVEAMQIVVTDLDKQEGK